jgi:hypothetical protein
MASANDWRRGINNSSVVFAAWGPQGKISAVFF